MTRRINIIIPVLLLLVFVLPTVVKLEHHHKYLVPDYKTERPIPKFIDHCPICNFEFYFFLSGSENSDLLKEEPVDNYFDNYYGGFYSNLSHFSFSLRSPPDLQI